MEAKYRFLITLLAMCPAVLLKWFQRAWHSDDLHFLLYPVQYLVGVFTGLRSTYLAGEGYLFQGFLIEKSCAGLNFLVIIWAALAFLSFQNEQPIGSQLKAWLWSIPLGYGLCILANSFRIISALLLLRVPGLHGPNAHEALGVAVYLSILLLTCILFHHFLNHPKHAKLA